MYRLEADFIRYAGVAYEPTVVQRNRVPDRNKSRILHQANITSRPYATVAADPRAQSAVIPATRLDSHSLLA